MDAAAVAELRADFSVFYDPGLVDRPDDLVAAITEAQGLVVRNRTQVRGTLLAAARRLRAVGRLGVGLDNIDVDECQGRGIAVLPATGANETAVAEYVVATSLILLRNVYAQGPAMLAGDWPREGSVGREIAGRRMGLVGLGAIARQVAARAHALGMSSRRLRSPYCRCRPRLGRHRAPPPTGRSPVGFRRGEPARPTHRQDPRPDRRRGDRGDAT